MKYRMKRGQEAIEVVDGPLAGKRFAPGREYDQVPEADRHRFEEVPQVAAEITLPRKARKIDPDVEDRVI